MLQSTKVLFFGILLIFLSSMANAKESIYLIDKGTNTLSQCENGPNKPCSQISLPNEIRPNALAISKNGSTVVISSENNHLYVCSRSFLTGLLSHCLKNRYEHFRNPQGVKFDSDGYLFVANEDESGSIIICKNIENHFGYSCKKAYEEEIPYSKSITISSDNSYAYITQPNLGTFQICKINQRNDTFSSCFVYKMPSIINKPVGITLDHSEHYLLIVDAASPDPFSNTISCPLHPGGGSVAQCNAWNTGISGSHRVDPPITSIAITHDGSDYPVLIGTKNKLFTCTIVPEHSGKYVCFRIKNSKYENLFFIAYTQI